MSTALEEHGRSAPAPVSYPPESGSATRVPLTEVDEAVHLLDSPAEPWSIELEVQVPGRIDDHRLRAAVAAATARHPMARVRLLPARRTDRRWFWDVTSRPQLDPVMVVEAASEEEVAAVRGELQSISVPLVESPPFRVRLVHGPHGDSLMLNANHAAFDGFGCMRFLQSVARAYTAAVDPPGAVSLTQAREIPRHLGTDDPEMRRRRLRTLAEQARNAVRAPARIAPEGGSDQAGYGIIHRALTADETSRLDEAELPGTVNDLLVAALHLAVEEWNSEHGASTGRIAVFVPVNLRPSEWQQDVVTNFVLLTTVASGPEERSELPALLEAIGEQTTTVKAGGGAALFELLKWSCSLPLWAKEALNPFLWITGNRLVDTALLTNLVSVPDPPSFGDEAGETEAMWFSAPARMPCGVSLGALTLGGRLHLSLRYRHPLLGDQAAAGFLGLYVDELLRAVAS